MVIVDGYNLIYADERLQSTALFSLEKAREELMDLLCNYVSYTKTELILVFDAYLVKNGEGSEFMHNGYKVVYTKANQTADAYIEKMMYELGPDYSIRMVTDDKLLQFSAVHSGISRMTTKEFLENLTRIGNEITDFVRKLSESKNREIFEYKAKKAVGSGSFSYPDGCLLFMATFVFSQFDHFGSCFLFSLNKNFIF